MRLKMIFQLKKPELDIEYRRAFLSLLKKSFQETSPEVYKKLYSTGTKMKPFTFGVFLPQPKFSQKSIALGSKEITLNFSTYYSELGIYFYNSLIKKRKRFEAYPLPGDNSLRLQRVHLIKEKPVKSTEAVFKTLSPFLVRLLATEKSNKVRPLSSLLWKSKHLTEFCYLCYNTRVEEKFIGL